MNNCQGKTYPRILFPVVLLMALAFVTACASSSIALKEGQVFPHNEGFVFGRVRVFSEGKEWKDFSGIFGESKMSLLILPVDSSQGTYYPLSGTGYFFWHLEPGDYAIAGFDGIIPGFFSHGIKGRVFADFKVAPGVSTYIGTLKLLFVGNRHLRVVEDEYSAAVDEYINQFSKIDMEIRKNIMVIEEDR